MHGESPGSGSMVEVIRSVQRAVEATHEQRHGGRRVGVIPTMGALHEGHLSLVKRARQECDWVVATIFVNPLQFGPSEDLDRYPRTWEADLDSLASVGADAVFAPSVETMYPEGATTTVCPPKVAETLEGGFRPGHFEGVATVVLKLFQILPANCAYFGRKDYQQCLVIRDMVTDLNVPIELEFCETVREPDGLAMSSRNRYLSAEERVRALSLSQGLALAQGLLDQGEKSAAKIEADVETLMRDAGIREIDYVAVREPDSLAEIDVVAQRAVLLLAAHVGSTRLIDNRLLTNPKAT